ncbi:unnamed protein product, partial [Lymnaea stagnalis]
IVGIIGIVTNIINMLVLFRHGMDDSTNIVLFGLSASDLVYSFCETYGRLIGITIRVDLFLARTLSPVYVVCLMFIGTFGMVTSVWLVSLISIERMIAVCFPFHVSRLMSPIRMRSMVVFVFTFVALLYSPSCCVYYLDWSFDPRYNRTLLTYFERKEFNDNIWWIFIILLYIFPAFASSVPMIIILVCTLATILKLIRANKNVGNSSSSRAKRVKEMRSIKISLIICGCMAFSILIPNAFLDAFYIPEDLFRLIRAFAQLAVQINATMNFFIYVALSSKFKSTCLNLIQCDK